ncbi:BQ5605_C002g01024 [Microbotryum silenes-dioicae]|uniref:BQ5605_C002g01024 protein n=1 Tax=Microbotryum silenes-dioicae TaxID=796604 RepID=A0A2X0NVA1_9BASI|nr:BQ5605_C002g01024 [Microbotryum silenes-dioicae]
MDTIAYLMFMNHVFMYIVHSRYTNIFFKIRIPEGVTEIEIIPVEFTCCPPLVRNASRRAVLEISMFLADGIRGY